MTEKESINETYQCPDCDEMGIYRNPEKNRKIKKGKMVITYECPNGHKFDVDIPTKSK